MPRKGKGKTTKRTAPPCVIVDLGSCSIKAGFAGIETSSPWLPDISISTAVLPTENRATMIGDIARNQWDRRAEVIRPIKRGKICDIEKLKLLLTDTLCNRMEINPKKQHILFADAPGRGYGSSGDRKDLMEWALEKLGMLSCMFIPQPVLGAFATGRTTATVVDSGFESSSSTVVIDGAMKQKNVMRLNHPSQEDQMLQMLLKNERISTKEGDGLPSVNDVGPCCRQIAEKTCYCYVGQDVQKEINSAKAGRTKRKYQLPDGSWLPVSVERFLIPETLFGGTFGNRWNPSTRTAGVGGLGNGGLGGAVAHQLKQHYERYWDLSRNIIAIGGRSETEGFDARLDLEISKGLGLLPRKKRSLEDDDADKEEEVFEEHGEVKTNEKIFRRPKIVQNQRNQKKEQRINATWAGGAMISSIDAMRSLWITKEEFKEMGADVCLDRRRMS